MKGINRRDFLGGIALTGLTLGASPMHAMAQSLVSSKGAWTYPPEKMGMRGSHKGSFEIAHALAWEGKTFDRPKDVTDGLYDLVIVGGGISGLAAAVLAQEKLGADARILILDNHDDFGGHAKRNEFSVNGKKLIGYGGSQSIDGPGQYSLGSKTFLETIGINTEKFYRNFDQSFYDRHGMRRAVYLPKQEAGRDMLHVRSDGGSESFWTAHDKADRENLAGLINKLPLVEADKAAMYRWFVETPDWLEGKSRSEKITYLKTVSYEHCMQKHGGFSAEALALVRNNPASFWGFGWDALSGLEAVRLGEGGTQGLGLDPMAVPDAYEGEEPYIFHFPDGNAGIARLSVAKLIPDAISALDMDDVVKARVHYDRLDLPTNNVRIRLSSTVVEARNVTDGVEVTYIHGSDPKGGDVVRVRARAGIMACYGHMLPHIMPELGPAQIEALEWPEKTPLTYVNVALTNWRAFKRAGVRHITTPGAFYLKYSLDYPVSMGGYQFSASPNDPIVLHMVHVPTSPGLPAREQAVAGRHKLYSLPFDAFEQAAITQLTQALGPFGFDAASDIAGITVNRWPHGYAYEYNELFDGDYTRSNGPHILARQRVGKLTIAGSDSQAYAYVNGAVDAAIRAVDELFG